MTSGSFAGAHLICHPFCTKPYDWGAFQGNSDRITVDLFVETQSEDPDAQRKPSSVLQHHTIDASRLKAFREVTTAFVPFVPLFLFPRELRLSTSDLQNSVLTYSYNHDRLDDGTQLRLSPFSQAIQEVH